MQPLPRKTQDCCLCGTALVVQNSKTHVLSSEHQLAHPPTPPCCTLPFGRLWIPLVTMQNFPALQHVCKPELWTRVSGRRIIYPTEVEKGPMLRRGIWESSKVHWFSCLYRRICQSLHHPMKSKKGPPLNGLRSVLQPLRKGGRILVKLPLLKCTAALLLCLAEVSEWEEQELIIQVKKGTVQIGPWAGNVLETEAKPVKFPVNSNSFFNWCGNLFPHYNSVWIFLNLTVWLMWSQILYTTISVHI